MKCKFIALLLALLTLLSLVPSAFAHDAVNLDQEGSITVTMTYKEKPLPGGTLKIYRVGDIVQENGNYSFVLTDDFASLTIDLNDLGLSKENAAELEKFIADHSAIRADGAATPDAEGDALFEDLTPGMYLIRQTKAASGYSPINPFLVSLPYMERGRYRYNLTANPKARLRQVAETVPPKPSSIPQTGQLWWPAAPLLCGGLCLLMSGIILTRKKEDYEA